MDPHNFVYSAVLLLVVASLAVAVFRHIGNIDKEAREIVPIDHAVLFLFATQGLGFPGSGTKASSQFGKSFHEQRLGDGPSVVKPQRHQYLVAT